MNRCSLLLLAATLGTGCGGRGGSGERAGPDAEPTTGVATRFAARLSAAYRARDASAAAALYAEGAVSERIGEPTERADGRAAIAQGLSRTFSRYRAIQLEVGRVWVGRDASVIEHVFAGTRRAGDGGPVEDKPVGAVGALVVTFDRAGLVTAQRLYLDEVTLIGQTDPRLLPDGMTAREVTSAVPAGSAVSVARGTPAEENNRATNTRIWAALSAHRVDEAMAPMADDYLYVDFAAPRPLDRETTRKLVAGFLAAVPDLVFVDPPPVVIAAGDDVVTEVVERGSWKGAPITLHALDVRRFAAGKVIREWQYSNYREVLDQLADR
jgi:ketosteroid isomerase-like protein